MKQTLLVLFVFLSFLFYANKSKAQQPQTVIDFFLLLPDTVFSTIHELDFAPTDSFPIRERTKMLANFDEQKTTFAYNDPRFHIVSENEKNRLLSCTTNELNFDLKIWNMDNGESLIAVSGNYKDELIFQTIKFYNYKDGKLKYVNPLPANLPIKLFFDSTYCEKQYVEPDYPISHPVFEFSPTNDDLKLKVQTQVFKETIVGEEGHPLTHLNLVRIKRPWILFTLQGDKFVVVK